MKIKAALFTTIVCALTILGFGATAFASPAGSIKSTVSDMRAAYNKAYTREYNALLKESTILFKDYVLIDNATMKVTITGYSKDNYTNSDTGEKLEGLDVTVKNKTNHTIALGEDCTIKINGVTLSAQYADVSFRANTSTETAILFYEDDLSSNHIGKIKSISGTFTMINGDKSMAYNSNQHPIVGRYSFSQKLSFLVVCPYEKW